MLNLHVALNVLFRTFESSNFFESGELDKKADDKGRQLDSFRLRKMGGQEKKCKRGAAGYQTFKSDYWRSIPPIGKLDAGNDTNRQRATVERGKRSAALLWILLFCVWRFIWSIFQWTVFTLQGSGVSASSRERPGLESAFSPAAGIRFRPALPSAKTFTVIEACLIPAFVVPLPRWLAWVRASTGFSAICTMDDIWFKENGCTTTRQMAFTRK